MKAIFEDYKLIKRYKQPPDSEPVLCKSECSSEPNMFEVRKCNKCKSVFVGNTL